MYGHVGDGYPIFLQVMVLISGGLSEIFFVSMFARFTQAIVVAVSWMLWPRFAPE